MAYIHTTSTVKYNSYVQNTFELKTEITNNLYAKACLRSENNIQKLAIVIFCKKNLNIVEYKELIFSKEQDTLIISILFAMIPKKSKKIFRKTEFVKDINKSLNGFKTGQINVYNGEIIN